MLFIFVPYSNSNTTFIFIYKMEMCSTLYVYITCKTLTFIDQTWFPFIIWLDATDIRWLFRHKGLHQGSQTTLELGHHLCKRTFLYRTVSSLLDINVLYTTPPADLFISTPQLLQEAFRYSVIIGQRLFIHLSTTDSSQVLGHLHQCQRNVLKVTNVIVILYGKVIVI